MLWTWCVSEYFGAGLMRRWKQAGCGVAIVACSNHFLLAGMPAPLPDSITLEEALARPITERLQALSFFLVGLVISVLAVRWLWNHLQKDVEWLPRLTVSRAFALVSIWGLGFVLILTMISGARELFTPGAWRQRGFTYKLDNESKTVGKTQREERLLLLFRELVELKVENWPENLDDITADLRELPGFAGLQYLYFPGDTPYLLVEPSVFEDGRLAVRQDGVVVTLDPKELKAWLEASVPLTP